MTVSTRTEARTQSIKAKLVAHASATSLPYDRVLTLFLLERAAHRLLLEPKLAKALIFKGGYINVRVYSSPRHTTDIDAIVNRLDPTTASELIKRSMAKNIDDAVWFSFEKTIDLKTQNEYGGTRFVYRVGLGKPPTKLNKAQILHIDIGIGDPVTPAPYKTNTPLTIGEGHLSWQVYPIETILAEKLHSLVDRGGSSSRSKDVYDISLLLPRATPSLLKQALEATFAYRATPLKRPISGTLENISLTLLKRGWQSSIVGISDPPTFEAAFASVLATLKEWGI